MKDAITVETAVHAPLQKVWDAFTSPEAIMQWNAASEDWHCPRAENELKEGGTFSYRMEAKDGSEGFDLTGTFTSVVAPELLAYELSDGRTVETRFTAEQDSVRVTESFEPESENTHELQKTGWQAILDRFKQYVEEQS